MRLYINDVAVRDGFQIEKHFVPTATKIELVNQLSRTGLHKIEVTSFVSAVIKRSGRGMSAISFRRSSGLAACSMLACSAEALPSTCSGAARSSFAPASALSATGAIGV